MPTPSSRTRQRRRAPARRTRGQRLALWLALGSCLLAAPAVARLTTADLLAALGAVPGSLADLPATAAREFASATGAVTGRHLGFDTHSYPGDRVMRAWKEGAPYEWVGYYLPAPCHQDASWSGKRESLEAMGWGTAVIYVGQQTWEGEPPPSKAAMRAAAQRGGPICDRTLLSPSQGAAEGTDAIARTGAEGFPNGTVVFLDIEYMARTPASMRAYYRAWVRTLLEDGRYRPGIYVHTRNAQRIYDDVAAEYARARVPGEPPFWVAGGRDFTTARAPHEVGHGFAAIWQGALDTWEVWNGFRLPIDVNVAAVPSPSSVQYANVWTRPDLGD